MTFDDDFGGRSERHRKLRSKPKPSKWDTVASLRAADDAQTSASQTFAARVRVTNTERDWIDQHLAPFHRQGLIDDVLQRIKAGKEATVYLCSAPPGSGRELLAAKLYRARSTRSLKNIQQYQEGRSVLNGDGQQALPRAWRLHKAIAQKSKKGLAALGTSWLMHEFELLTALHRAGADVPQPIDHNEQALLMEFVGEGLHPAPTLSEVTLSRVEAQQLCERVLFNVELLLQLGWVHGDLSAYNILYRHGQIVLIDFPQVASARDNPQARALLERDLERVAQYFARAGVALDARGWAQRLWSRQPWSRQPWSRQPWSRQPWSKQEG